MALVHVQLRPSEPKVYVVELDQHRFFILSHVFLLVFFLVISFSIPMLSLMIGALLLQRCVSIQLFLVVLAFLLGVLYRCFRAAGVTQLLTGSLGDFKACGFRPIETLFNISFSTFSFVGIEAIAAEGAFAIASLLTFGKWPAKMAPRAFPAPRPAKYVKLTLLPSMRLSA